MNATLQTIGILVTCAIAVGGMLIFIGRSLGTLNSIGQAVEVALKKTDKHDTDIARIDMKLAIIETRQEDCAQCP